MERAPMSEPATLAAQWAALWEVDYEAMVDEIYARDVVIVHAGHRTVTGREGLLAAEVELKAALPDHRMEIVRVVDATPTVVVEGVITATGIHDDERQACPACVWWTLDADGRVGHEVAFYEWSKRRPDDGAARGTIIQGDGGNRPASRYRSLATRMAELWTTDPIRMVDELYAADTVMERLGDGPDAVLRGSEALREAEGELLTLLPVPHRRFVPEQVAGAGDVMAIRFTITGRWRGTGPRRAGPGTIVLTLGAGDRIVSDRAYWHWNRAAVIDE